MWASSARRLQRVLRRIENEFGEDSVPVVLARSAFRKEAHTTMLYVVLAIAAAATAVADRPEAALLFSFVLVPVILSVVSAKDFAKESRLAEERFTIERRAEEVLTQDQLAPQRWAARLAPQVLPDITGFEVGKVYKAGTGLMAGDFYDVFRVSPNRVAAVIGDVTGHGIEPSITAFQAKYLLRVFLRQFRDPAQALEELNDRMSALEAGEELISLCVVVFDTEAQTLRWASAGHPTAWLWHEREVRPLRATGPLLMLDPKGTFISREIPLESGDLVLHVHRRAHRGPRRRAVLRRGAGRQRAAPRPGRRPRGAVQVAARGGQGLLERPAAGRRRHPRPPPHLSRPGTDELTHR